MSRMGDTGNAGSAGAGNLNESAQRVSENLRDLGGQVREAAKEKYEQISDQAQDYYQQGRDQAMEWEQTVESFVHEKPVQAILIAAGVGLLLGLMWRH